MLNHEVRVPQASMEMTAKGSDNVNFDLNDGIKRESNKAENLFIQSKNRNLTGTTSCATDDFQRCRSSQAQSTVK